MLAEGLQHHQTGRFAQAENLYRKILALDPRHADSLHLLGMIDFQAGRHNSAVETIQRAIAVRGNDASYHLNLGAVLQAQDKLEEAVACYERAVLLKPNYADAHYNLGLVLQRQAKWAAAAECHQRVLALAPNHAAAHFSLGIIRQAQGQFAEAVEHFHQATALRPGFAEAHANLGAVLYLQGKVDESIAQYERAIACKPDYPGALNNLGIIFQTRNKSAEAKNCYERALAFKPDYVEANSNLGKIYHAERRYDQAIAQYQRALALKPDSPDIHFNLGVSLQRNQQLSEAVGCYQRTLALKPNYAAACNNLGAVLELQGSFEEAAVQYRRSLEIDPNSADAVWNQCLLQLLRGDFNSGLPSYERRWGLTVKHHNFTQPQWRGEPLHGARILLHAEQGLGDTLQFLRYLPLVQAAGGSVVLAVQSAVQRLARELPGVAGVVTDGDPMPAFDCQCALLSLPLVFGTTLDTIPAEVPYLPVPEEARRKAATLSWPAKGLRVGIVWAGNATHVKDRYRSIPSSLFEPLLRIEGAHFYSLQMGPEAAQLDTIKAPITDLTKFIEDLADTAALMTHLDLILAVDTSVVHLAGALGKKVWVMLPLGPDWRWLLHRDDSPWYPSMRLFRQTTFDDWHHALDKVQRALMEEIDGAGMERSLAAEKEASR